MSCSLSTWWENPIPIPYCEKMGSMIALDDGWNYVVTGFHGVFFSISVSDVRPLYWVSCDGSFYLVCWQLDVLGVLTGRPYCALR